MFKNVTGKEMDKAFRAHLEECRQNYLKYTKEIEEGIKEGRFKKVYIDGREVWILKPVPELHDDTATLITKRGDEIKFKR